MLTRSFATLLLISIVCHSFGQAAMVRKGGVFERSGKNMFGDLHNVVNGVMLEDGTATLHVFDTQVHKVVKLDGQLLPTDELLLKDIAFDGLMWNGVTSLVVDGTLHCLLVAEGKKAASYAIAAVNDRGVPALNGLRKIATSELPYVNELSNALIYRPMPDAILFSRGLKYAHNERIIAAPDGQHFLLNNYTYDSRGNKQFWFAYLDKDFKELWSGLKDLPLVDVQSRVHQIGLANDGTIHLMMYNFRCATEEQMRDKLCHELHFTTLSDRGNTISDLLVEKDFISSARFCERDSGQVTIAMRYGALTGQPGVVMTFDPMDPKLKSNPVVDQRAASIRKSKLMAYGSIEAGSKKSPVSKIAKVPDEIVDIRTSWNGGVVVVETLLDDALQIQMGDVIAMRRLAGDVRVTQVADADTIQWQYVAERAFMTTTGQAYEGLTIRLTGDGVTLLYDHTPRGLTAILASGRAQDPEPGAKGKKDKMMAPAEAGVMKVITLAPNGTVVSSGTAVMLPDEMMPCPSRSTNKGSRYLVKSFDRSSKYTYTLVDAAMVGD